MATRNRVIYQSEGLFISKEATSTGIADHEQLRRVQSANYSYTINRQDVNQYGELARIDSLVLEPPTVAVDFSYYLSDGFNERCLNFYVETGDTHQGNFASGHLTAGSGVNIYVVTSPEGEDLNAGDAYEATDKIIGIGNCYLSDYSIDLSVGSLPTASVSMEGANVRSSIGGTTHSLSNIRNPSVNQEDGTVFYTGAVGLPVPTSGIGIGITGGSITALRPGDITMDLENFDDETISDISGASSFHIQSATISVPLSRTPLDRLGSKFAFARTVDFPVVTTLSVSAIMNETDEANLSSLLEKPERNVSILMKDSDLNPAVKWDFKGALVESESWSSSIGSNKSVDLTLTAQIGGPEDIQDGVFMSGVNAEHLFV
jgi:hypothetical protein